MLAYSIELSLVERFALSLALQTQQPESNSLSNFLRRITPTWWIIIGVLALVLLGFLLYYFTIDEIELGIPPKIKFKRRASSINDQSPTPPDVAVTQPSSKSISDPSPPPLALEVSTKLQPNLVHPYPLQANFTGRVKEREQLTAWLADDEHPIYELVAMGGMGKSALTWYWLTRDVLPSSDTKLDGVMWWSFYEGESSFAKFVDEALKYLGNKSINADQFPTTYDRGQELRKFLQNKRVLFVLDGFERQLRAYASLDAPYTSHDSEPSAEARSCVDPITSRLLRDIAAVTTRAKVLLTSRLTVSDLEDRAGDALAGALERQLEELSRHDAIAFMRAQGVKKGTDAEVANVCEGYGYHALSLRLLSGLIARDAKMPGDIAAAPRHEVFDDLVQRQHHVLEQSYDALPKRERELLSRLAAFRGPMSYEALTIFNEFGDESKFDAALGDLQARGHIQRDIANNRYDLHPIVRRYAYDRLTDRTAVHTRLRDYFATVPTADQNKLQSIEDLAPVIELHYHTANAGLYDEAVLLFRDRLNQSLFFHFSAYQTQIELLRALFPDREADLPRLSGEDKQGWVLNELANSYSRLGQLRSAVRMFQIANRLAEKVGDKKNIATGLENLANEQGALGEFAEAWANFRLDIELATEAGDEFYQATGHQLLGRLLAHEGAFDEAENEMTYGAVLHGGTLGGQWWQGTSWLYRAESALLRHEVSQAMEAAREAKRLKEIEFPGIGKIEALIIHAEWLLGETLVMEGSDLKTAATHLTEALTGCRRTNLLLLEPDILLAWARWHRAKGNTLEARAYADEALALADRSEYRLKQADIHNFLALLALDGDDRERARKEAEIAKERAWCDGPPHCYKPALDEAEKMLKELRAEA